MAEYIEKVAFNYAIREAVRKYPNSFYNGLEVARQIAHNFPAADVQPVKRGKWLDLWIEDDEIIAGGYTVPQCSECKEDNYGTTPFCPFCGADMRGSADV